MTYPEPQNLTEISTMMQYSNNVSDGMFGIGLIVSLYIIVFLYLKNKQFPAVSCATSAGFITAITAIILNLIDIIPMNAVFITIVGVILPIVGLYSFNR